MEKLITIKESQRKLIWKANHLFAAAQAVEAVALSDEAYRHLASGLEAAARSLVLQAGDNPSRQKSSRLFSLHFLPTTVAIQGRVELRPQDRRLCATYAPGRFSCS